MILYLLELGLLTQKRTWNVLFFIGDTLKLNIQGLKRVKALLKERYTYIKRSKNKKIYNWTIVLSFPAQLIRNISDHHLPLPFVSGLGKYCKTKWWFSENWIQSPYYFISTFDQKRFDFSHKHFRFFCFKIETSIASHHVFAWKACLLSNIMYRSIFWLIFWIYSRKYGMGVGIAN